MADERTMGTSEWARAAARTGVPFGIAMGVFGFSQDHSWWRAAIVGVLTGVLFGAYMGRWLVRQQRASAAATGIPAGKWTAAQGRSGLRHPASASPELREDLRRILERRLSESERGRRRYLLTFGGFGVLTAVMALTDSPWWWLVVPIWVALFVVGLTEPARLHQKLVRLDAPSA